MRFAKRAIQYERKRQIDLLESGGKVKQQTLNFDPESGRTSPLREKEDAHDYRYFPDPDLPPVILKPEEIDHIKKSLPPLPDELLKKFKNTYLLSHYDAAILSEEKEMAILFDQACKGSKNYKGLANLFINKIKPWLHEQNASATTFPLSLERIIEFVNLIQEGKVSAAIAYQRLFPALIEKPDVTAEALAESLNLIQSADEDFLSKIVDEVLTAHPDKVKAFNKGKKNLIGFFMGQVMRSSGGKADPKATNALLMKKLTEKE